MTTLAILDFEDQTDGAALSLTTPWSTSDAAPIASTDAADKGTLGARIADTGTASRINYDTGAAITAARVLSWYARWATLPTSNGYIAGAWDNAGTVQTELRLTSGGVVQMRNGSSSTGPNSPALSANQWYRFEWMIDPSTASQSLHIYEGDSTDAFHSGDGGSLTSTTAQILSVGPRNSAGAGGVNYDIDTFRIADDWTGPYTEPEQPTTTPVSRLDAGGTLTPVTITPLT